MVHNLELFQNKVVCQLCNNGGGGLIYKVELSQIKKTVFVCDECDSLWENANQIMKEYITTFGEYIEHYGYTYDTIGMKNIDYYWYTKNQ